MSKLPENLKILIADDDEEDVLLVQELVREGLSGQNIEFLHLGANEDIEAFEPDGI